MGPRWRAGAVVAVLWGAVVAATRVTAIYDPDYFWHLYTGRYLVAHRRLPDVDPFSHTFAGHRWHYIDWLSDVAMYALYRLGGHAAVVVAFALAGGAAVALALWHAQAVRPRTGWGPVLVTGALLAAAVVFRVTPRPQTATFALLALELCALEAARRDVRWLALVPPLVALWQNVHSSGVVAWLVLAAWVVGAWLDARRHRAPAPPRAAWLALALGAAALLAAPHPLDRLGAGYAHLGDPRVAAVLPEWSALWDVGLRLPWAGAFAALVVLAALGAVPRADDADQPLARALTAAGLAVMAARTIRFVPLAAIAATPLALAGVARVLERGRPWLGRLAAVALTLPLAWLTATQARPLGTGIYRAYFPIGAAAFVQRAHPRGPMYNDFFHGGYLLWTLGDAHPVFIDGRSLALYGIAFVREVSNATPDVLERLFARYNVGFAVVYTDQRLRWLQAHPGWSLVYFDDVASVVVRDRDNPDLAARARYTTLHPADWADDVDALRAAPASLPAARAEAARAVAEAPDSPLPRVTLAAVALAADDAATADGAIATALRLAPTYVPALRARVLACVAQRDRACACTASAAVLARAPNNGYARRARAAFRCDD